MLKTHLTNAFKFLNLTSSALRNGHSRVVILEVSVNSVAETHFEGGRNVNGVTNANTTHARSVSSFHRFVCIRVGSTGNVEANANERFVGEGACAQSEGTAHATAVVDDRVKSGSVVEVASFDIPCDLGGTAVLVVVVDPPVELSANTKYVFVPFTFM